MVRVWVRVMMAVTVPMVMSVRVAMRVVVVVVTIAVAMRVVMTVLVHLARADALYMMMMALLRQTHLGFEPDHLLAILAQLAVHGVLATQDLLHTLGRRRRAPGVVVQ